MDNNSGTWRKYGTQIKDRLKTVQPYFNDIRARNKNFEIRYNDRDYRVGDVLILMEYNGGECTGQTEQRTVKYVLKECPQYGLEVGYCILALA